MWSNIEVFIIFVRFLYLVFFSFLPTIVGWGESAHAIGLGELHIQSGLGQGLQANVRLLGAEANEINRSCIRVKIATAEGVFLAQAAISIIEMGRGKGISMSTEFQLNEPAIKITVDVNCEVQLHRDFLVLLDPPEFLPAILSHSPNADIKFTSPPRQAMETSSSPQLFEVTSTAQHNFQTPKFSSRERPQKDVVKIKLKTIKKIRLVKRETPTKDALHLSDETSFGPEGMKISTRLSPQLEQQVSENMEQIRIAQRQMVAILRGDAWNKSTKADLDLGQKKIQALTIEAAALKNSNKTDSAYFDEIRKNSFSRNWVIGLSCLVLASLLIILILFMHVRRMQNVVEMSWWEQGREKKEAGRRRSIEEKVDDIQAMYQPSAETNMSSNDRARYVESEENFGKSPPLDEGHPLAQELVNPRTPTLEESSNSIFNFYSSSGSSVKVEEISDITQEAEFWMSVNDPQRAIEILVDQENVVRPDSPVPWLYLLDLYRLVKDKSKYDNLKNRFIVFFNAHIPEFDEKLVDVDVGVLQLENYPHLIERICRTWGGGEIIPILESLLVDDRAGQRTGFELPVYRDILLLISIANELEKMRAIDGSTSNLRSGIQEEQTTPENIERSKNDNKLNAIEFEVIDFPKNAS